MSLSHYRPCARMCPASCQKSFENTTKHRFTELEIRVRSRVFVLLHTPTVGALNAVVVSSDCCKMLLWGYQWILVMNL